MEKYYLNRNAQPTGEHEVHKSGRFMMPEKENCIYLGLFNNAIEAVEEARRIYSNAIIDGCYYCSEEAHRR